MAETIGVDANGYIRTVAHGPLQAAFLAVIVDLRSMLLGPLGHRVHSAYLYGSVARGDAVLGRSDLDVVLVLAGKPALQDDIEIEAARRALETRHPEVLKVDFDVGFLEEVLALENLHRWGFWLKHHCRCIYGYDLAGDIGPFIPSRKIARAVNGDFSNVLNGYAHRIGTESDPVAIARLAREASRKLIRATNMLRPIASSSWPESLEDHLALFVRTYPQMAQHAAFFHSFAAPPGDEPLQVVPSDFVDRLRAFSALMLQEL
ncbi:nucleotidyltransferase domain-containing protein [Acidovorax sp. BLS4]|uniref:nucleotidyltransferase domain-containing protein n=1 Tax=Acidovorax sp. BLS4 TaxID=3273430 RepID=UPI002942FCC1|nr:nucleotidyltransferase domain-containing protein [Paracidovorax avenae]WOI46699.1 nucleotidyltransferase domain-containing protein [Paracidovorax avenae]